VVNLSVAIQHHPKRAHLLPALLESLALAFPGVQTEVVTDPDPDAPPSSWRTYRAALERRLGGDSLLVIQDDAEPCDGFFAWKLERVLARHQGRLLVLCVCR